MIFVTQGDDPSGMLWRSWLFPRLEALMTKYPEGIRLMVVVLPDTPVPAPSERARVQGDLRKHSSQIRKQVTVILGDSMRASIVRAIMRTMLFLSGQSKNMAFTATIRGGIDALLESSGPNAIPRAQFIAAVEELLPALGVSRDLAA